MEDGRVSPTATHTPAPIPTATPAPTPTASEPSPKGISQTVQHLAPQALRHAILHTLDKPVVFRGYLAPCDTGWHCLEWPLEKWAEIFGDQKLKLRVGQRIGTGTKLEAPQWEGECQHASMTLSAFLAWAQGHTTTTTTCGTQIGTGTHWAYFDYYYLREMAQCRVELPWGALGFPEYGTAESTLWLGSAGANTPCHIDTYGINLVAQVYGHKRWVLFPECQTQYMSATRVPYEESSIYSSAGFPRPSRHSHPDLALTTPHVVTLEPGDVLLVPRRWWHSVENLDLALSVNNWVPVEGDATERVKEALVMFQVVSLCQGVTSVDLLSQVFNPNMFSVAAMTSSDLLTLLLDQVRAMRHSGGTAEGQREGRQGQKKHLSNGKSAKEGQRNHIPESATQGHPCYTEHRTGTQEGQSGCHSASEAQWDDKDWLALHGITPVPSMTFLEYESAILGMEEEEEGRKKRRREEEGEECRQKVPEGASTEFSDLKLLIDVMTDRRVTEAMLEVMRRRVGGGGQEGEGGAHSMPKR